MLLQKSPCFSSFSQGRESSDVYRDLMFRMVLGKVHPLELHPLPTTIFCVFLLLWHLTPFWKRHLHMVSPWPIGCIYRNSRETDTLKPTWPRKGAREGAATPGSEAEAAAVYRRLLPPPTHRQGSKQHFLRASNSPPAGCPPRDRGPGSLGPPYPSRLPSLLLVQGGVCTAPRPTYPGRPSGRHAEA